MLTLVIYFSAAFITTMIFAYALGSYRHAVRGKANAGK